MLIPRKNLIASHCGEPQWSDHLNSAKEFHRVLRKIASALSHSVDNFLDINFITQQQTHSTRKINGKGGPSCTTST